MPAAIMWASVDSSSLAGPMVATILVRRVMGVTLPVREEFLWITPGRSLCLPLLFAALTGR